MDRFLVVLSITLGIVLAIHLAGGFETPSPAPPRAPVPTTAPTPAPVPIRHSLITSVSPSGSGTISPSSGTYDSGTVVTLTATSSSGYQFDHWSGDASGMSPSIKMTMNSNKRVIANFSRAGKITFVSDRDGNSEIYVMDIDGSNQMNLTNNPAGDWYPRWSPDGKRITFFSKRDGNAEIYVMDADGQNQINLTNDPAGDYVPDWSPDGRQIIFVSDRDGNEEIYIMDADGSNQANLTNDPAPDKYPVWSPDGSRIAFVSERGKYPYSMFFLVHMMNADGTGVTRIEDISIDQETKYLTDWSPDGKYLAISKKAPLVPITLKLLEVKSGYAHKVKEKAYGGSFSPDSSQLAFSYVQDENWEICIFDVSAGKIISRLTNNTAGDWYPAWAPR